MSVRELRRLLCFRRFAGDQAMMNTRGLIVLTMFVVWSLLMIIGFHEAIDGSASRAQLCNLGHIDACARTGGIGR
jgi:hypothetical protein